MTKIRATRAAYSGVVTAIGLLHPGDMGAAVGAVLVGAGHDVAWVSDGRSAETATRAREAGLRDVETVAALAGEVDVIVSLCPPHAALDTARAVAGAGFAGVYVDANAIAPGTAATVAELVSGAGARAVDGGVIGLPPRAAGTTRLYLSGDRAAEIAAMFDGTTLEALVVEGEPTAASALKMHYAAWTKGTTALLMAIRAGARGAGIEDALAGRVGALAARSRGPVAGRRRLRGGQGLALDGRDGGDRGDARRARPPRRISPRGGRDLRDAAPRRRCRRRRPGGCRD